MIPGIAVIFAVLAALRIPGSHREVLGCSRGSSQISHLNLGSMQFRNLMTPSPASDAGSAIEWKKGVYHARCRKVRVARR